MANGAPISLTPQFQRFGVAPQAPIQAQPQQRRGSGINPLALALGAAGRGLIEGGSRGGLGTALLGATSAAIPAFAQGQQAIFDRQRAEEERQAALVQQELENQRARAKALAEAGKEARQAREFGITTGLKQQKEQREAAKGEFKVVGTDLFDVSGKTPKLAARGRRASEPLVPVFDSETGETRFQTRESAVGRLAPPKSGFEVVTDPTTGQTTVRTGVTGGGELGTKARNQIESQSIDLTAARERLNNIASAWKPEFSQLPTQLGMKVQAARDRVGLLPPEQQASLAEFTRFQQNTIKNLNSTIKEITGAAMNQQEVPRIQREVPNETDSPAVFEAKLRNAMELTGLAQARLAHLRTQGLPAGGDFGGIELDDMPSIMDARGAEIEAQMVQQGFDPQVAEQQAFAQVRQEFGF